MVIVVMGVAGAGKTTVGRELAHALGWPFHDADDFHPPESIAHMRQGVALTEAQRAPWLAALAALITEQARHGTSLVLASSALRRAHRRVLLSAGAAAGDVRVVYLRADPDVLAERIAGRTGHFFPPELLADQLATLEPPSADEGVPVLALDADRPPAELVRTIREWLAV